MKSCEATDFLLAMTPAAIIGVMLELPPLAAAPIAIAALVAYHLGNYRGNQEQSRKHQ